MPSTNKIDVLNKSVLRFFFFFRHGSARHASGCQKGAAEEPLRGRLNSKP